MIFSPVLQFFYMYTSATRDLYATEFFWFQFLANQTEASYILVPTSPGHQDILKYCWLQWPPLPKLPLPHPPPHTPGVMKGLTGRQCSNFLECGALMDPSLLFLPHFRYQGSFIGVGSPCSETYGWDKAKWWTCPGSIIGEARSKQEGYLALPHIYTGYQI